MKEQVIWGKGDRIRLMIADLTDKGEGVGHLSGFAFFVKDALPGDEIEATVMKVKSGYAYAHLDRVTKPSPDRITPPCPVARACGGCVLQALSPSAERTFKERRVRETLIRIGGLPETHIAEVMLPMDTGPSDIAPARSAGEPVGLETSGKPERVSSDIAPARSAGEPVGLGSSGEPAPASAPALPPYLYRYRNKAQVPVATGRDGHPVAGFYAARTHQVIPVEDCLLGHPVFAAILRIVLSHMEQQHIPAYDEKTGTGLLRHVLMRRGHHSGQVMACLVVNQPPPATGDGKALTASDPRIASADAASAGGMHRTARRTEVSLPGVQILADRLFAEIPGMTSLSLNCNDARTNVILGRHLIPIRGPLTIEDTMCDLRFEISPLSFYQVNTAEAERLYEQAMEFAALTGTETVIDLYCGIGTITLLAAKRAKRVIGVEIVPEAIEDARRNAERNHIGNAEFHVGKAEELLPALTAQGTAPDVLIVDPPRAGLDPACTEAILKLEPRRLVYISCNPATLARDCRLLEGSYRLMAVKPFNLFGRTGHVESCVLLERVSNRKADSYVKLNVKMEDYYRIKDAEKKTDE